MTRQNRSKQKDRLKAWLLENREAMKAWRDEPEDAKGIRLLCDLVRQAGIYSKKTSTSDIPIGSAICQLLDENRLGFLAERTHGNGQS